MQIGFVRNVMKPALIQYLPVGIADLKDYDIILS